jgi:hypothetical protein
MTLTCKLQVKESNGWLSHIGGERGEVVPGMVDPAPRDLRPAHRVTSPTTGNVSTDGAGITSARYE